MTPPPAPTPDEQGGFASVVVPAPPCWPWALPHWYAVNTAPDPGFEITGASASRDGTSSVRERWVADRTRIETIGYWRGAFGLVAKSHPQTAAAGLSLARELFGTRPTRYLMVSGRIVEENSAVSVTGEWPAEWKATTLADLGTFCAFLFEQAATAGAGDAADQFKGSIHAASPPTEQLIVYIRSMEFARAKLAPHLDGHARHALEAFLHTARAWLSR
ncbi:MAG TPA: hypothetical protein VM165_18880 [Planctomycetaceae bacterium]|nr:hypothetical protein [Planctomycetaceae bacterium]